MEHFSDWISLALRWLHFVAGAAWIGTSFYFNWLNNNVREPEKAEPGVGGEVWSIHGGHFYRVIKYTVAPEKLPKILHWFKWEAYVTWISGMCLLAVVYYLDPTRYLVDANVRALSPLVAVAIAVGVLGVGWVVYHYLCKSPLGKRPALLALLGFALLGGTAYGLVHTFGSRAAYIHFGALIGTIMAANVFYVIIPNQRAMVDAMIAGKEPEAQKGIDAAQRSRHNNYFTLPVLFVMVSNHYPFTFGHEWSWAILAGLSLVGAAVRHWFNLHGMGQKNVWILPAASVAMIALAFVTAPKSYADHPPVEFADVRDVIQRRCIPCHSASPTQMGFVVAPQGVMLDTPQQIQIMAGRINSVAVAARTMPLGNMTNITDAERDVLGAWFYQGASIHIEDPTMGGTVDPNAVPDAGLAPDGGAAP